MSVFVPSSEYSEIDGRKRSTARRKASSVLVKFRSEDSSGKFKHKEYRMNLIINESNWLA
jgi:hypothetical protein